MYALAAWDGPSARLHPVKRVTVCGRRRQGGAGGGLSQRARGGRGEARGGWRSQEQHLRDTLSERRGTEGRGEGDAPGV